MASLIVPHSIANVHAYVNDGGIVRIWQDGCVEEQPGVREIDSVEELRALADPVRLAILSALETHVRDGELPVMSVKELAQHLGEPQTKLYRHVKQLEAAGLIEVAATRMVSGILEQRYRARQRELRLSTALYRRHADESEAAIRSAFDAFLTRVFELARQEDWPPDAPDRPVILVFDDRVSLDAAERIRARLVELTREIAEAEAGDVPVNVAVGFYRPTT
jgi:DNA-binding transcriptional ArsR family regulator